MRRNDKNFTFADYTDRRQTSTSFCSAALLSAYGLSDESISEWAPHILEKVEKRSKSRSGHSVRLKSDADFDADFDDQASTEMI